MLGYYLEECRLDDDLLLDRKLQIKGYIDGLVGGNNSVVEKIEHLRTKLQLLSQRANWSSDEEADVRKIYRSCWRLIGGVYLN